MPKGLLSFSSHNDINEIKTEWTELDRKAEENGVRYVEYTYYQTYEWNEFLFHHTTRGFGKFASAMRYHLVRLDGRPFAIIPTLVTRLSKKVRIPSCRVAGVLNISCPYTGEWDGEMTAAIAGYIETAHKGMKISFADVPMAAPFAGVMKRIGDELKERTSYHVPLDEFESHEDYVASLNKNIYKNIRKAYNHLKTDSKRMELKVYRRGGMPDDGYMRSLWKLYLRRKMAWRHRKTGAMSEIGIRLKAMYETCSGCANRSLKTLDAAELYVLHIDDQPAAFMIVYRHRNHLLMPKLAIDTSFSRYSPGILLILEASKRWIDEGVADFDMCRGDERYKKEMGGQNEPLCRIDKRL